MIFSMNESAQVVWEEMERHSDGMPVEELVDYLEQYYFECDVPRSRLKSDAEELTECLFKRGFLKLIETEGFSKKYRIKEDVFRTSSKRGQDSVSDETFNDALRYRPSEEVETGHLRAMADTCLGLMAILTYEVVLRMWGFSRLCVMVERWPINQRRERSALRVRQVLAGIDRARLWYPKKVQCLQHSAVVTCLLRREGVAASMVFGAERKPFYAHAWSEVMGTVVNDEQSVRRRYSTFCRCLGPKSLPELAEAYKS